MMNCCRCNRSGRCLNCSCVKNKLPCKNCLPLRLGNCGNKLSTTCALSYPSTPSLDASQAPPPQVSLPHSNPSTTRLDVTDEVLPQGNTPDSSFRPPSGMSLPPFTTAADPVFTWGEHDATLFIESLTTTYLEAIHWKINLFKIPYGGVGKLFVTELARLFKAFAEASALEAVALKAATIMPILLLQKPAKKSTAKDHTKCLQRRLNTWWREGDLMELLGEGHILQKRIPKNTPSENKNNVTCQFSNHMFRKAALRLQNRGVLLHLDDSINTGNGTRKVAEVLVDKHPSSQPIDTQSITNTEPLHNHPVVFEALDSSAIKCHKIRCPSHKWSSRPLWP